MPFFFLVFTLIRGVTQFFLALGISANTRFPLPRWLIKVFHYLDELDMYIIECIMEVQYFLDTDWDKVECSMMTFLMAEVIELIFEFFFTKELDLNPKAFLIKKLDAGKNLNQIF